MCKFINKCKYLNKYQHTLFCINIYFYINEIFRQIPYNTKIFKIYLGRINCFTAYVFITVN